MVLISTKQQETDTVTPHMLSSLSLLWNSFENCQRKQLTATFLYPASVHPSTAVVSLTEQFPGETYLYRICFGTLINQSTQKKITEAFKEEEDGSRLTK